MNYFELFTLIYFWLDKYYSNTSDDRILTQLSDMDPFIWADLSSGDSAVFSEFCAFLDGRNITIENSLSIAADYVKTINYADMTEAFKSADKETWEQGCMKYLKMEHKGSDFGQ